MRPIAPGPPSLPSYVLVAPAGPLLAFLRPGPGINLAASLHWMAATDNGTLTEYCLRPSPLLRRLVNPLPPLVNGHAQVPNGPGLGIELDEDVVEDFFVK